MANIKEKIDQYVEHLMKETLEDIVSERFKRYSKYIIQDRALPDARDGLKPVQRRILYAMQQMGMTSTQPYKKSARIAGEVMGKYHPHGDSSIYDAMVRLSQDFKMRLSLIDMHGNNGSIDGDSAAAMRYTEARLSKASEALLQDIDKRTVPFIPNFDDEEMEPTVLPAKFPNLLVNGASGISAGYATKIPPHNLKEVIQATIALIEDDQKTAVDLMKYMKGPDFPTGGLVQGKEGILQAFETGAGKIILRAVYDIEDINKNQHRIVIHQIPFDLNKADLVRAIDQIRVNKKIEDIQEVRDESDQEGLRIAIDLKKQSDPQFVMNYLFKNTDLQVNYHYNMVAILNHRPVQVGIVPILKAYIQHQKEVTTNRSNFELAKATKRQHIVEGLIRMVDVVQDIIDLIRQSKNKQGAKDAIIEAFHFSDVQAEAIVTLQLYRLSNTDILALENEAKELEETIQYLNMLLESDDALSSVIKEELLEVSKLLSTSRLTQIEADIETIKIDEKELVIDEKVMMAITKDGYIKRANLKSYQLSQSAGLKQDDAIVFLKELSSKDTLLLFTDLGRYIYLPVYKVEEQKWKDLGMYIPNIVQLESQERIIKTLIVSQFSENETLILVSKLGQIKQAKLSEFEVVRYQKASIAMSLQENDELVDVVFGSGRYLSIISEKGMMLSFDRLEIPFYSLNARGVKAMTLKNDLVSCATTFEEGDIHHIVTQRGHLISIPFDQVIMSKRTRKGQLIIEPLKKEPHQALRLFALPQEAREVNISVYSDLSIHTYLIKEVMALDNKYGKQLISKKEKLLDTMIDFLREETFSFDQQAQLLSAQLEQVKQQDEDKKNEQSLETKLDEHAETSVSNALKEETHNEEKDKESKEKITLNRLKLFDDDEV